VSENLIPTREEHRALIWRVWRGFVIAALIAFLGMGGIAGTMLALGYGFTMVAYTLLVVIYVLIPLYALGYMGPILASSIIKMTLGIEMTRDSMDNLNRTAETIDAMQKEIRPVVADLKEVVDEAKKSIVKEKLLDRIAEDMKVIRQRVERDTEPLPVRRRSAENGSLIEVPEDGEEA